MLSLTGWGLFGLLAIIVLILRAIASHKNNGAKLAIGIFFLTAVDAFADLRVAIPLSVAQGNYFRVDIGKEGSPARAGEFLVRFCLVKCKEFKSFPAALNGWHTVLVPVAVDEQPQKANLKVFGDFEVWIGSIEIKKSDFPVARGVTIVKQPTAAAKQRRARELKILESIYANEILERYFDDDLKFAYPLAALEATSFFGEIRRKKLLGTRIKWSAYHNGVDFRAPEGTKIFAAESGVVRVAQNWLGSGNTVIMDHGHGLLSFYFHLSKIKVKEGQSVQRGGAIGLAGHSGNAQGSHLHFEIRLHQIPVNPHEFLGGTK